MTSASRNGGAGGRDRLLTVGVAAELAFFLKPAVRGGAVCVACDGVSSLGHVVESIGVPLTEVGALVVGGEVVTAGYRPRGGDMAEVRPVERPQRLPGTAGFVCDVHLGTVARRLRLVGVDTLYLPEAGDDDLIGLANAQRRVLLTQDRALLKRRALRHGAYVRGTGPDEQFADVLDRFAPRLAPWTRCPACNGLPAAVAKAEVEPLIEPGTRRTYQEFSRCQACGRVFWRGAHAGRLEEIIRLARASVRPPRR